MHVALALALVTAVASSTLAAPTAYREIVVSERRVELASPTLAQDLEASRVHVELRTADGFEARPLRLEIEAKHPDRRHARGAIQLP